MIQTLITAAAMITDLEADAKPAALDELLRTAQQAGAFAKKGQTVLAKRLREREAVGSTGLGNGVAVPHCKGDEIATPALVLARSKAGIEWQAIDGRLVHIAFLLVSPASDAEVHLRCLRWISRLARSADFRRFLLDAKDAEAMRELLREMSTEA